MAAEIDQLSNTDKNLWRAIVSEALANLKYNAYAIKAMEEGLPEVAQVFQEVSGAETIHGINHLRVSGEIGTSLENLRAVSAEEIQGVQLFLSPDDQRSHRGRTNRRRKLFLCGHGT